MITIRVEMSHFNKGKRKRIGYTKDYEVRESFWEDLKKKCEEERFSFIYKHDTERIRTLRNEEMNDWFKENCRFDGELDLLQDIKYESYNGFIDARHILIVSSFEKRCEEIVGDYAYFYSNKGNKFSALISDRCKDIIKVGSLCWIKVTATKKWIVTDVDDYWLHKKDEE